MPTPLLVVHRRNRIDQLKNLPKGCWVELDIEPHEGTLYLSHDHLKNLSGKPDRFADYLPQALAAGVAGFVIDCKREAVEKTIEPLLAQHGVRDYFYLNEMEVQADIYQSQNPAHSTGMRIWKYRGAGDVIRMVRDMKKTGGAAPQWIWVDCWQRGLLEDIHAANVPLNAQEARELQGLGVKLCICSPELYVHKYDTDYAADVLAAFHAGTRSYKKKLAEAGIMGDSICTKFPDVWFKE